MTAHVDSHVNRDIAQEGATLLHQNNLRMDAPLSAVTDYAQLIALDAADLELREDKPDAISIRSHYCSWSPRGVCPNCSRLRKSSAKYSPSIWIVSVANRSLGRVLRSLE